MVMCTWPWWGLLGSPRPPYSSFHGLQGPSDLGLAAFLASLGPILYLFPTLAFFLSSLKLSTLQPALGPGMHCTLGLLPCSASSTLQRALSGCLPKPGRPPPRLFSFPLPILVPSYQALLIEVKQFTCLLSVFLQ